MELILVLVLIAIMAALIVPEMKGSFEDSLLRSSGRKLVDVFNLASSRAISFNQQYRVHLEQSTGRYIVERQAGDSQDSNDFEPVTDIAALQGQIDPRIAIEVRASQEESTEGADNPPKDELNTFLLKNGINFYPDGTADGCEIMLRDRMGFRLILEVNPITAALHLRDEGER